MLIPLIYSQERNDIQNEHTWFFPLQSEKTWQYVLQGNFS